MNAKAKIILLLFIHYFHYPSKKTTLETFTIPACCLFFLKLSLIVAFEHHKFDFVQKYILARDFVLKSYSVSFFNHTRLPTL